MSSAAELAATRATVEAALLVERRRLVDACAIPGAPLPDQTVLHDLEQQLRDVERLQAAGT